MFVETGLLFAEKPAENSAEVQASGSLALLGLLLLGVSAADQSAQDPAEVKAAGLWSCGPALAAQ